MRGNSNTVYELLLIHNSLWVSDSSIDSEDDIEELQSLYDHHMINLEWKQSYYSTKLFVKVTQTTPREIAKKKLDTLLKSC